MKVAVLDKNGKSTGREVELPKELFGVEPNEHLIYLAVKQHLAAKRQGTSKAKNRNEIAGSTRKIKRQKGTGTARAGSIKNPLFRGGGTIFGPQVRQYKLKMNKKEKQLAKASALSAKVKNEGLRIVEDLSFDSPKTKDFQSVLKAINCDGKVLFVHNEDKDGNVAKSARNINKVNPINLQELNTYDIMNADNLVICESVLQKLAE